MVMERIYGVQISDIATLKKKQVDLKKLAEYGVEIFFTQVFRDSFFHADMHPGNLFVNVKDPANPQYLGVDFGIMGSLSQSDQRYLGENLLAFFSVTTGKWLSYILNQTGCQLTLALITLKLLFDQCASLFLKTD